MDFGIQEPSVNLGVTHHTYVDPPWNPTENVFGKTRSIVDRVVGSGRCDDSNW